MRPDTIELLREGRVADKDLDAAVLVVRQDVEAADVFGAGHS